MSRCSAPDFNKLAIVKASLPEEQDTNSTQLENENIVVEKAETFSSEMPLVPVNLFLSWSTGNRNVILNDTGKVLYKMIGRMASTAEFDRR